MGDEAYATGTPSCVETSHPLTCLVARDQKRGFCDRLWKNIGRYVFLIISLAKYNFIVIFMKFIYYVREGVPLILIMQIFLKSSSWGKIFNAKLLIL